MKTGIYLIIILSFLTACSEQPEAFFETSNEIIPKGDTVYFQNKSKQATSFFWEFGDNAVSTEENPNHTYIESGDYVVKLTAKQKSKQDVYYSNVFVEPCKEHFTGLKCETQIPPKKIKITSINIDLFPQRNTDGYFWDGVAESLKPDVFIDVLNDKGELIYRTETKENLGLAFPVKYICSNLTFEEYDNSITIAIYDQDLTSTNDFMGSVNFVMYHNKNGFPISQQVKGSNVAFEVFYEYFW